MDRDKKVERILRSWQARPDNTELRRMAEMAVDVADGPEEWGLGEEIPTTAQVVWDDRGIIWTRTERSDCFAAEFTSGHLTGLVGTVYAEPPKDDHPQYECPSCGVEPGDVHASTCTSYWKPTPERKTQPTPVEEECPKCGDDGPHKLADVMLRCCACDHFWIRDGERCGIEHPRYGFVCDRVRDHYLINGPGGKYTWHHDSDVGHSFDNEWRSTADERPGEQPAADQDATQAYLTVLSDAAAVLDAAQTTLTRVGNAYREKRGFNAAMCHTAEANATLCDQASTTLNSLIKAKEQKV